MHPHDTSARADATHDVHDDVPRDPDHARDTDRDLDRADERAADDAGALDGYDQDRDQDRDHDRDVTTTPVGDHLDQRDADTMHDADTMRDDRRPVDDHDVDGRPVDHDDLGGAGLAAATTEKHDVHDFERAQQLRRWDAGSPEQDEAIRHDAAREDGSPVQLDPAAANAEAVATLFPAGSVEDYRARWKDIQVGFVDDPRTSVQGADELVSEVMRKLAETFEASKRELEGQWRRDGDVETEDLRLAMRKYRSFFDQMLRL